MGLGDKAILSLCDSQAKGHYHYAASQPFDSFVSLKQSKHFFEVIKQATQFFCILFLPSFPKLTS